MRRLLLAATAVTVCGPVFAADLIPVMPTKAPVNALQPPPFTWTGCYLGGNVGAGWGQTNFSGDTDIAPTGNSVNVNAGSGFLGGGQVGCNFQVASNWAWGAEADFSWADIAGNANDPFFANKNLSSRTDSLASVTGRIGYTWDRWMLYGKGGAAWAQEQYAFVGNNTSGGLGSFNDISNATSFGWTVGGGIEWAFAPAWSAKVEFDYYGFGSGVVMLTDPTTGAVSMPAIKQNIEAFKFGINYRFVSW